MIKAEGIVDFIYKPLNIENYTEETTKKIKQLKNRFRDKFKVISISLPYKSLDDIVVQVSCNFTIHLHYNYNCKIIDDYVGYVFPTLQERLGTRRIVSTRIKYLTNDRSGDGKIKTFIGELNDGFIR